MRNATPTKSPMLTRTRTSITSKNGVAWRTAVAAGVKPKNLKAFGPENA